MSENVKQKNALKRDVFGIVKQHVGLKYFPTNAEADNAFWKRPNAFFDELRSLPNVDVDITKVRDYPADPLATSGFRDLKEWGVTIKKLDNPVVTCKLRVTTFGQDEAGDLGNELSISGGCYIDRPRKSDTYF